MLGSARVCLVLEDDADFTLREAQVITALLQPQNKRNTDEPQLLSTNTTEQPQHIATSFHPSAGGWPWQVLMLGSSRRSEAGHAVDQAADSSSLAAHSLLLDAEFPGMKWVRKVTNRFPSFPTAPPHRSTAR